MSLYSHRYGPDLERHWSPLCLSSPNRVEATNTLIESAEEFIHLRSSPLKSEYDRSAWEEVPLSVWYEVIDKFPDYRQWVIHNKTVPLEILEHLSSIAPELSLLVATKRKLSPELFERLSRDADSQVRLYIANNRKAPMEIVERLMLDPDADVAEYA